MNNMVRDYIKNLSKDNMIKLFTQDVAEELFKEAYQTKLANVGNIVYLRGLIEISNICINDCYYCGIRRSNSDLDRYLMSKAEVLAAAEWAYQQEYGSIVLQAGDRNDEEFISFIEDLIGEIKKIGNGNLGLTLSLGEQSYEVYKRWYDAGAHRYLLRIETTNPKLFSQFHPKEQSFDNRLKCIEYLKQTGYQVGTGVMIGLPGQTIEDLVNDILFFKEQSIDMIGMGPYIIHQKTPLSAEVLNYDKNRQLELTLRMIALTRLYCPDINIAATTALQTLDPIGREKGLLAGANIIMPNLGATEYKKLYFLYDDKPCSDEGADMCKGCLEKRIKSIGEKIGYNKWGDSPHFHNRPK